MTTRGYWRVVGLGLALTLSACGNEPGDDDIGELTSALTSEVTPAQAASPVYQAYQAFLARRGTDRAVNGQVDTLEEYAARCDLATGIHVPGFNCDLGTEVPKQGSIPDPGNHSTTCDKPNVLNGACDPGSKFQVLVQNGDAAAVGHCRKNGIQIAGSQYNDIAVIQYNKKNGAVCFYQALGDSIRGSLPGQNVAPPSAGMPAWRWLSPTDTENIKCTGCHDNGGFIRSPYLAQLTAAPNAMPSTAAGFDNLNTPLSYVGLDFVTNRSWSISTGAGAGDTGLPCTTCHRLGVNNAKAFNQQHAGQPNGTGQNFANVATAATQFSKSPHSTTSPIWMRPGQITYSAPAEASATKFRNCALGFWTNKTEYFTSGTATSGCTFTTLGTPWTGFSPAQAYAAVTSVLM
jgi:hypothetical protein